MLVLPLILNAVVITALAAELIAIAMGMISANQLLIVSAISGMLVLMSFMLSRSAMLSLEEVAATAAQMPDKAKSAGQ